MAVTVSRKAHFNAAHRLYRPDWDDAKNEEIFGKCNNPHYHGHKNLNLQVPYFANLNPTAENIAVVIWNKLRPHISSDQQLEVTLYETPRNYVHYKG
jgi:6-pyruvoyltetrahydropterin/6-carboxytetrahydropterin synthase